MLPVILAILAIAAIGGVILAAHVLRERFAPWPLSVLHALLGATALVLLAVTVVQAAGTTLIVAALVLLVIAALGGFFLASFHLRRRFAPKPVVVLHALLAVSGFVVLLAAAFG